MTQFHKNLEFYIQSHVVLHSLRMVENVIGVSQLSHLAREQCIDKESSVLGFKELIVMLSREIGLGQLERLPRANLVERRQGDGPMVDGDTSVFPHDMSQRVVVPFLVELGGNSIIF